MNLNAQYAMNRLQSMGYAPHQAAGIVGNLMQESGLNSTVNPGDNGRSFGIAQWNGPRLQALQSFAQQNGSDWRNLDTQIDFLHNELNTTEKSSGDAIRSAPDTNSATLAMAGYERPQGWTPNNPYGANGLNNRLAYAQQAYGQPEITTSSQSLVMPPQSQAAMVTPSEPSDNDLLAIMKGGSAPVSNEPSDDELVQAMKGQSSPNNMDDFARPAKALAAGVIGGVPDLLMLPGQLMSNLAPQGSAARQVPSVTQMARSQLDKWFPTSEAQTQGQRFAEGAAGFGGSMIGPGGLAKIGEKALPEIASMLVPKTLGDVAAGFGGAAGAGTANAVAPNDPVASIVLPLLFGGAAGLGAGAIGAGKNAIAETAKPFTQAGRQDIVGQAYRNAANDPQRAIQQLENVPEYVPNSRPMAGAASGDYGLLALQKGLRNENGPAFADAESAQNAARNIMLDNMAKTDSYLNYEKQVRDVTTTPMREQAFSRADLGQQKSDLRSEIDDLSSQYNLHLNLKNANSPLAPRAEETSALEQKLVGKAIDYLSIKEPDATPLNKGFFLDTLRDSLSTPQASRQSVEQAVNWVFKRIGDRTDPRSLYEVRKDINDAMQGKYSGDLADLKLAKGELKGIKNSLDQAIESAAPGYEDYLKTYAAQSKPINQMEALQDIKSRVMLSAPDAKTGYDFISQPKWSNVVQSNREELAKTLTPQQLSNLDLITQDLDRGALVNNPAIRSLGSDTQRNQTMAQFLGSIATGRGLSKIPVAGKAFEWMQSMAQKDIDRLMVEAMLDPQLARQLMQNATMPNIPKLADGLKRKAIAIGLGSALGPSRMRKAQ